MEKQPKWDKYEIALLIDACERAAAGTPRKEIVRELSVGLRKRAVMQGNDIDELFRNENGITLQLIKMEYLLTDEITPYAV